MLWHAARPISPNGIGYWASVTFVQKRVTFNLQFGNIDIFFPCYDFDLMTISNFTSNSI